MAAKTLRRLPSRAAQNSSASEFDDPVGPEQEGLGLEVGHGLGLLGVAALGVADDHRQLLRQGVKDGGRGIRGERLLDQDEVDALGEVPADHPFDDVLLVACGEGERQPHQYQVPVPRVALATVSLTHQPAGTATATWSTKLSSAVPRGTVTVTSVE